MSYQSIWFRKAASQLQLLDRGLSFDSVRAIISDRLPLAVQEMQSKGIDLEDPASWWELLFINEVIKVENAQGKQVRVAVCLLDDWKVAVKTLAVIESKKFEMIRTDLGIDRHWIVFADSKSPYPNDLWIDVIYGQIDLEPSKSSCASIEM